MQWMFDNWYYSLIIVWYFAYHITFLKIPFLSLLKTEKANACLCLCRCSDFFSEEKDMCMSNSSAGKCTKSMNTVKKTI